MRLKAIVIFSAVFMLLFTSFVFAKDSSDNPRTRGPVRLAKSAGVDGPVETILNINSLESWVNTNGHFDAVLHSSWNGSYPRGSEVGVIFREGIVWGVKVTDADASGLKVRVGGSSQTNGLQGGKAVGYAGSPSYSAPTGFEDPADQQVWRVRTDYLTADLAIDAASFNLTNIASVSDDEIADLLVQYKHDWDHWPAGKGAPYDDVDGNGSYDPTVDVPGFPGASQTLWFVSNDLDPNVSAILAGSPTIGLEMQLTLWAYDFASTSPLGNMSFKRVRLIYTGQVGGSPTASIDTMYVTQWADPDLGDFGDDFVGTDVETSLGYIYNANTTDNVYFGDLGIPVPAAGYDFLQGPVNAAGDTLGMSSFTFFGAGGDISDPDRGVYTGTLQWFNLMEGFLPRPEWPIQQLLTDPIDGTETKFWVNGDPVSGTGWVDGIILPPGDRRLLLTTGPFQMALGDTQDIVVAYVAGIGLDNISSITVMRFHDSFAQFAFDENFILPSPPSPPLVTLAELDGRVVINWGGDATAIAKTEETVIQGFAFEGYNVYQLPTAASPLSEALLLATFDVANLVQTIFDPGVDPLSGFVISQAKQFGTNSGIQRFFSTGKDALRNRPMSNGVSYHFGVTAYSFLSDNVGAPFKQLESSPIVVSLIPQAPVPGTVLANSYADAITVIKEGSSTARVEVSVVNPGKMETADFTVFWKFGNPTTGAQVDVLTAGDTLADGSSFPKLWNLTKGGTQILSNQSLEFAEGGVSADGPIIDDAFQLKVFNPAATALEDWNVPVGERWVSGTNWGGAGLFGGLDLALNFFGTDLPESGITPVQLLFQDQADVDANGYVSKGATYRRDLGYPWGGVGELPFSAWDTSDPDNPRRLNISFVENEDPAGGIPVANLIWDMGWFGAATGKADLEIATLGGREYIFIHGTDYQADGLYYSDAAGRDGTFNDGMWSIWPASRGRPFLLAEFTMNILPSIKASVRVGTDGDIFTFSTTAATTGDVTATADDVENINVFPNPYYGLHELESSRYNKFVTLNHLPQTATIRVFNLGGQMVRVLNKNDDTQFIQWDLQNQNGFPVASGIYIIHIEMPDFGSKILKLALVQEEQILRNY